MKSIGIQAIRTITTGIRHRCTLEEVGRSADYLSGGQDVGGYVGVRLWLKTQLPEARFWEARLDKEHEGAIELRQMTQEEVEKYREIAKAVNLLQQNGFRVVEPGPQWNELDRRTMEGGKAAKATHIRTGLRCRTMPEYGEKDGMVFCDFGERQCPFTWVAKSELRFD